jgi:hypothetical protein
LCDAQLQQSFGGPLNGQKRRQELFCELVSSFQIRTIIEAGTYRATTAEWIAKNFEVHLYTCETNKRFFYQSKEKLENLQNASIELCDSVSFLRAFVKTHPAASNIMVYLDAHTTETCPLLEELELLRLHLPKAVIMIDDFEVPADGGYGFTYYDFGCIGLAWLQKFKTDCHIYFPSSRSEDETGARRGVAVLSWDSDIGRRLGTIAGLKAVTESDWALAMDGIEHKPLASAEESTIGVCEGALDAINGIRPSQLPTKISETLTVHGWLAMSASECILPDTVFATLTDTRGHKVYFKTWRHPRPDVAEHFKQPDLLLAGFEAHCDVRKLQGLYSLGISRAYNGKLENCRQLTFPVEIGPKTETSKRHFGRRRQAPVLLIKRWGGGFWADVDHVVGQLAVAEILGRVPVIQWGTEGPYGNGLDETFTLYFEPLSGLRVEALEGSFWPACWTTSNIESQLPFPPVKPANRHYDHYQLWWEKAESRDGIMPLMNAYRDEDVIISLLWEDPELICRTARRDSRLHGKTGDELRRLVVSERLRLQPAIQKKIEGFWNENLEGHRVLAVHARGTAK